MIFAIQNVIVTQVRAVLVCIVACFDPHDLFEIIYDQKTFVLLRESVTIFVVLWYSFAISDPGLEEDVMGVKERIWTAIIFVESENAPKV